MTCSSGGSYPSCLTNRNGSEWTLWHVILDQQYRLVGRGRIPAVEPEEVRDRIVIVVRLEAQTKLSEARPVDEGMGGSVEPGRIPAAGLSAVRDQSNSSLVCWSLKV